MFQFLAYRGRRQENYSSLLKGSLDKSLQETKVEAQRCLKMYQVTWKQPQQVTNYNNKTEG